jgi:hypothetical protein
MFGHIVEEQFQAATRGVSKSVGLQDMGMVATYVNSTVMLMFSDMSNEFAPNLGFRGAGIVVQSPNPLSWSKAIVRRSD